MLPKDPHVAVVDCQKVLDDPLIFLPRNLALEKESAGAAEVMYGTTVQTDAPNTCQPRDTRLSLFRVFPHLVSYQRSGMRFVALLTESDRRSRVFSDSAPF
jgi:hypothetical protein